MDEIAAALRRERAVSALLPLFFVSGATALVYQTIWSRQLHLVFGTSSFAIATVLSAFMAGLAIGGFWMGRHADRIGRALGVYGLLEIGIGVYALIFPTLIDLLSPIYLATWTALEPSPAVFGIIQFLLVGVALIAPTAMMGATLPLLARFATARLGAAGDRVGTLYAVNTAGAVFGTWLAGFILLPAYGLWATTVAAAACNVLLGLSAIALDLWSASEARQPDVVDDLVTEMHPSLVPVAVALGAAGFASLVYEVAWTRLMGLMLGGSVYSFSTMLLAFLVGIAIGGKVGGPLSDRILAKKGQNGVLVALAGIEIGVAVTSYGLMYLYPELPFLYVYLFDWMDAANQPVAMFSMSVLLSALIMTPPAVLMGAAFPMAVRAVVGVDGKLGGPVGVIYGANTLGGVGGAFLAGFVLLPGVHVSGTILVAGLVNLGIAAFLLALVARREAKEVRPVMGFLGLAVIGLLFLVQRPPWDPMLMTAGTYHYVSHFEDHSREGILKYTMGQYDLVYYAEGLSSVVTVAENQETGNIWLANNGKVDASTTTDMPTQVLCSLLTLQFVDQPPADVLVIGLASGITAGALTLEDDIERLDIVELEPVIPEAAEFFGAFNHDVLRDKRVNLIANDGRNHVLLTAPGTYDIIVSEPSNPWISGVSNLFTKEFWTLGRTRLKSGGVWSQWVQMYGMDDDDLESLLATFASVFPHVIVYSTIDDADLVLLGSDTPFEPSLKRAGRLFEDEDMRDQMRDVDVMGPLDIIAMFQMDQDAIREATPRSEFNTDDNMRIEYSAPLHLHADTSDANYLMLVKNATVPYHHVDNDPLVLADLARAYQDREDVVRSVGTMATAIKMLHPDDPLREEMLVEAERWQSEFEAAVEGTDDEDEEDHETDSDAEEGVTDEDGANPEG
jgi:spermidine synthase